MNWERLPSAVLYCLAGLFALLLLATIVVWSLSVAMPNKEFIGVKQRTKTWWIILISLSIALLLSRTASLIFFGLVSFLALKEYLGLIPTRDSDRRVFIWVYLAIPFQYYWISMEWYDMFIIFIPVYLFLLIPVRMVTIGETKGFLRAVGTIHWGLMLTVFSISHLAYLLVLPSPSGADP